MKKFINSSLSGLLLTFFMCVFNLSAFADNSNKKIVFAQLSSSVTQTSSVKSTISFENTDGIHGLSMNHHNEIVIEESGLYSIEASGQAGSNSLAPPGFISIWLSRNHKKIPHTAASQFIQKGVEREIIMTHAIVQLHEGDCINVEYKTDSSFLGLIATPENGDTPAIPSSKLSIFKINK